MVIVICCVMIILSICSRNSFSDSFVQIYGINCDWRLWKPAFVRACVCACVLKQDEAIAITV